jgi:hypothetical protein
MEQAQCALQKRKEQVGDPATRTSELRDLIGPPPVAFGKPCYGTPGYALAFRLGWITQEQERADRAAWRARRERSLQTCHRYSLYERPRFGSPAESGAFVPAASARIENDRNLTDGARRCARKVLEETYRRNREARALEITVSYLAQGLGRCRRTIQRYLRLLEREGYIGVEIVKGQRSRLCTGLVIHLLGPLFPHHHKKKWPERLKESGATRESQNHRLKYLQQRTKTRIPRREWALKCMDGVFRALMKTDPLGEPAGKATG